MRPNGPWDVKPPEEQERSSVGLVIAFVVSLGLWTFLAWMVLH